MSSRSVGSEPGDSEPACFGPSALEPTVLGTALGMLLLVPPELRLELPCLYNDEWRAVVMPLKIHTLTAAPTEPDPTTTNGEALHLLNSPLGIWLANELNETAVFADWYLDLDAIVSNPIDERLESQLT